MADKTLFDYVVSGVALTTGAYTVYKNFIERASVSIVPGDRMAIISGPGGARRIHLRCTLLNDATKIGTLQHLEARITSTNGTVQGYLWNLLYEFVPGSVNVQPAGTPLPIPIPGKGSKLLLAQLEFTEPNTPANWMAGRYRVEVLGWVNRKNRRRRPNVRSIFHINISSTLALALPTDQPDYKYEEIQIEEWGA
jgi:hypothetical protein